MQRKSKRRYVRRSHQWGDKHYKILEFLEIIDIIHPKKENVLLKEEAHDGFSHPQAASNLLTFFSGAVR